MRIRNTFIIFLVSGFRHGANWTFIVWGGLNALYFLPVMLSGRNRRNLEVVAQNSVFPSIRELVSMLITFFLTIIAWVCFRAENVQHAIDILDTIASSSILSPPDFVGKRRAIGLILLIMVFILIEWAGRKNGYALEKFGFGWPRMFRHISYYTIILFIFWFSGEDQEFIYFQF